MLNMLILKLKLLKDDKIMIIIMTVMALVLTFVFSSSMGGTYKPSVVIVDNDNTELSEVLIKEMKNNNLFSSSVESYDDAKSLIEEGKVIGGVLIKKGFSESIENKEDMNISIFKVKDSMEIYQLENILKGVLYKFSTSYNTAKMTADFIEDRGISINREQEIKDVYELSADYWKYKNPMKISSQVIDVTNEGSYDEIIHNLIGFTLFFSTFTIVFVGGDILQEKKQNTWQRKLISPVSKVSIMMSFIIATFIAGFAQTLIIVLIGNYMFGVDWGPDIMVVLILFAAFVFAVTCMGFTIAGIVKTHEQLSSIVPIILVSSAMLGGCMWPLEIITSKPLLFLANLTPHKWALQTIKRTAAFGLDVKQVLTATGVLIFMGIIYLLAGLKLAQRNN